MSAYYLSLPSTFAKQPPRHLTLGCIQHIYHQVYGTVPLKRKLPVASRFRRYAIRVERNAIRVAQDSPKRKCLA